MGSTSKAVSFASSTRKSFKLERKSVSKEKKLLGECAPCNLRRSNYKLFTNHMMISLSQHPLSPLSDHSLLVPINSNNTHLLLCLIFQSLNLLTPWPLLQSLPPHRI